MDVGHFAYKHLLMLKTIKQKLHDAGINSDVIDGLDPVILDPFEGLGSAFLQEKFYADHFPFVVSSTSLMHYCVETLL